MVKTKKNAAIRKNFAIKLGLFNILASSDALLKSPESINGSLKKRAIPIPVFIS